MMKHGASLNAYLTERALAEARIPPSSKLSQLARYIVPAQLRPSLQIAATRTAEPFIRIQARRLARESPELKLHLGCGATRLTDWVNVGLIGTPADLFWDLRHKLPFADGSVSAVFHEHFLEHLPLPAAYALAGECARLIKTGGVLRIGVPDFGRYAESYLSNTDVFIDQIRPGRPTRLLALAEVVYCSGHRSVWDAETLLALVNELGFREARVCGFGESRLEPPPDGEQRRAETLYVEAVR